MTHCLDGGAHAIHSMMPVHTFERCRYADGNPAVSHDRFFWGDGVTTPGGGTGIAVDDDGGVWIIDNANRRLLRLNYTTGTI
jgi:streptogramin lyase